MFNLVLTLVLSASLCRLVLVSIIVFLIAKLYLNKSSSLPLPPGPYGVPILGFLPFVSKNFHLTLTSLAHKYGPIYQIYLGSKRVVVINDAKIIKEAFRQPVFSGRPDTELTRILQGYGQLQGVGTKVNRDTKRSCFRHCQH